MTGVADVDLLDPVSGALPPLEATHVLVWLGGEVLGAALLSPLGPGRTGSVRERVAELFAEDVLSRRAVRAAPSPAALGAEDVTVVVCTRDRPQLLRGCLEALGRLDPAPGEVLVVDNASTTSATRDVAESAGVRCVGEPEPGLDRARNSGWRSARTPVVAFVDDDARAHRAFAGAVASGFLGAEVGAVTGLVAPAELSTPAQRLFERQGGMGKGFVREVHHRTTWRHGVQPYRLGVGTNMAFRRETLAALGGFDPRLDVGTATRGGGDLDMLYRTMLAGWTVVYEPDAVVRHLHRRDWKGLVGQMSDNGTAFAALLAKYESEVPELARTARRERRRWHVRRHLRDPLVAVRRRDAWQLLLLLAEARGAARGRRALQLTARLEGDE